MTTYRGYPLFNVAEPQTKGIVRARAEQLSLCLEPLVAQRSILFRIQTELGDKEGYHQLSAESDYSSLQLISAQPDPSLSLSSKPNTQVRKDEPPSSSLFSTASVYSQESWRQTPAIPSSTPSPPPLEPPKVQESPVKASEPLMQARPAPVNRSDEHRRYAMALSPSMDWELGATSPSLIPLDLATRFIVDLKLIKNSANVAQLTEVKTNSKIISEDSPTTPTTADPFRAGGDAGGSFFLFQPELPDQRSRKLLRKKSTHSRTQSESVTSAKSTTLRRALSRLTFAPGRERADLPHALRRTKSQLVSPPPLIPTTDAQLPALHFSPIQLKLPAIPSAVTPSSSEPFQRPNSPHVTGPATPGPGPRSAPQKQDVPTPIPPPSILHRRSALKKAAPETIRRSYSPPQQLPTITGTPTLPDFIDDPKPVEEKPPPVPPLPLSSNSPLISILQQPTRTTVAILKRAPPPRVPLVSQAPQVTPKKVHRRYASSPAALNFRPQELPPMPPPPLPDFSKKLVELEKLQMQKMTTLRNA